MKKIVSFLLLSTLLFSCNTLKGKAPAPKDLGIRIVGKKVGFKPCPAKPNCISTFEAGNDPKNVVESIQTSASRSRAFEAAVKIILKTKEARLIQQKKYYLQVEYTSKVLGFVDDVELFFGQKGVVHFKSQSRLGHYDFGANKKRMENFKFKFHQSGL